MKLWGWWKKDEAAKPPQPELLDDLPPKFDDDPKQKEAARQLARPTLSSTVQGLGWDDFQGLPTMPCFRQAMLTGLGIGAVSSAVVFASRRSVTRTVNWAVTGFVVGAVISWEQCRYRVLKGKRNMRHAQDLYRRGDENSESDNGAAGSK